MKPGNQLSYPHFQPNIITSYYLTIYVTHSDTIIVFLLQLLLKQLPLTVSSYTKQRAKKLSTLSWAPITCLVNLSAPTPRPPRAGCMRNRLDDPGIFYGRTGLIDWSYALRGSLICILFRRLSKLPVIKAENDNGCFFSRINSLIFKCYFGVSSRCAICQFFHIFSDASRIYKRLTDALLYNNIICQFNNMIKIQFFGVRITN